MYFQVHQPFRFRRYRFFDIGNDHYYYDDYSNETILMKVAQKSYLPANALMMELIRKYEGRFRIALSMSGIAMEQFRLYAPEVLESFTELVQTGHVEMLSETYSHSLASLNDGDEFERQVQAHTELVRDFFGVVPKVFRNTELIYSDDIGVRVAAMGYRAMLTEGAKHVLGWKSPNFLYCNAVQPKLKLLMKNFKLSDDIAFRFSNKGWSEYPLTAEKYVAWLNKIPSKEEVVNLFMDYETFGEHQWKETGIFDFMKALPGSIFKNSKFTFSTPSEVANKLQVVAAASVPYPISWADEERDLTAWLGNEMQQEAFRKLYSLSDKVYASADKEIQQDYSYLQVSDHFYYMSTKFFSDGEVHSYFNPYDSPYDAFINYMNILSDFEIRVNAAIRLHVDDDVARLSKIITEKDERIRRLEKQLAGRRSSTRGSIQKKSPAAKTGPGATETGSKKSVPAARPAPKKSAVSPLKKSDTEGKPPSKEGPVAKEATGASKSVGTRTQARGRGKSNKS